MTPAADNADDDTADPSDSHQTPDGETDADEQSAPDEDADRQPDVPAVDTNVESVADDDSSGGKHRAPETK